MNMLSMLDLCNINLAIALDTCRHVLMYLAFAVFKFLKYVNMPDTLDLCNINLAIALDIHEHVDTLGLAIFKS